ncbi:MAG: hypothetical protein JSU82_08960 [Rhodospirillales bacterium]|nr:MAG: hypothetical protein JSU82_08960 [Rhodospirillales bacterium]
MATSYSQSPEADITAVSIYGRGLLEVATLFLILAVPLDWTGFSVLYLIVPGGLAAVYVIGTPLAAWRGRADLPPRHRLIAYLVMQPLSACVAVAGLCLLVAAAWIRLAYREDIISPDSMGLGWPSEIGTFTLHALWLAIGGIAALAASLLLLRRRGETVGGALARLRADGIAILRPACAAYLVLGFALLNLANVASSAISLPALLQAADPSAIVDIWLLVDRFPGFPLALLAVAILLVAYRRIQGPALGALGAAPGPRIRLPAVLAILSAIAGGYAWFLYMLHIGFVAALGAVAMIVSWGEVTRATDTWIEAQQAAGRAPAEIAATLQSRGGWTASGPPARRPAADPKLGGTLAELGLSAACSVTIDAGVADNSAVRNQDWIAGYVAGFRPLPQVSYCIRLACPSPAAWRDQPVVIFHSSHPSRNRFWAYNVFIDVFGAGAAPNPGGYCTETGGLADSYQG